MRSFYNLLRVNNNHYAKPFTTSWALSPLPLAIIRLVISLYAFLVIFINYGLDSGAIGRSFSFFTELTYWGISFYTLVAGIHTLIYALRGRCWLDSWPRPLQALHGLFYTTIITFPFLVTIVYWVLLAPASYFTSSEDQWRDISKHGLNSAVALFELIIPDTETLPWLYLPGIVLILALYLALAYLTHYTQGFYPYDFLDPVDGGGVLAGYIFGILAAACVIFIIVWVIILARKRFSPPGKVSKYDGRFGRGTDVEMSAATPPK